MNFFAARTGDPRTDLEGYEWNDRKARANLQKHGVDFVEATSVFAIHWRAFSWMKVTLQTSYVRSLLVIRRGKGSC